MNTRAKIGEVVLLLGLGLFVGGAGMKKAKQ